MDGMRSIIGIIYNGVKNCKSKKPALNKMFTLRRLSAARGYEKPSRANALCGFFSTHIFAVAGIASQFLYRNRKNVVNNGTLNAINS
jgi:hypothetical protein